MKTFFKQLGSAACGALALGALASQGAMAQGPSLDVLQGDPDGVGPFVTPVGLGVDFIAGTTQINGVGNMLGVDWPMVIYDDGTGFEMFFLDWTSAEGIAIPGATPSGGNPPTGVNFFTVFMLPVTFNTLDTTAGTGAFTTVRGGWTYDAGGLVDTCYDADTTSVGGGTLGHDCGAGHPIGGAAGTSRLLIGSTVTGGGTGSNGDGESFPGIQTTILVNSDPHTIDCGFIFDGNLDLCPPVNPNVVSKVSFSNIFISEANVGGGGAGGGIGCDMAGFMGLIPDTGANGGACFDTVALRASNVGGAEDQTITFTAAVPEPASLGLLGAGLLAMGAISRRRRKA